MGFSLAHKTTLSLHQNANVVCFLQIKQEQSSGACSLPVLSMYAKLSYSSLLYKPNLTVNEATFSTLHKLSSAGSSLLMKQVLSLSQRAEQTEPDLREHQAASHPINCPHHDHTVNTAG